MVAMRAATIIIAVLVVALAILAALYASATQELASARGEVEKAKQEAAQASRQAEELRGQLAQLQNRLNELQSRLAEIQQAGKQVEELRGQLAQLQNELAKAQKTIETLKSASYMYALVVDTVGGSDELFIYVIDPRTNDVVVKIPLRDRLPADVYTRMRNASLRLVSPSMMENKVPRYYTHPGQYLYILYGGPWGSYVAALDPKNFSLVKEVKTHDKFTRQHSGISPDGKLLVIALRQAQRLLYLDAKTLEVIRVVELDANPCDAAPSPDGNYFAIPVRADGDPNKPEYVLIIDREGREVARVYFKRPGEAGRAPTEPTATWWTLDGKYVLAQGEGRPYEAVIEVDVAAKSARIIKEVSYPSGTVASMAVEHPMVKGEVWVIVRKGGVFVRSSPPEYKEIARISLTVDTPGTGYGPFSPDGRYFYVVGYGGIDIFDVAAKSLLKTIKAKVAVWVIAIPSAEWLYYSGMLKG